ncbi:Uncharacterised protein [Mycobacteroides abscessus subsp. abscessus]|nr:Uncharacterised protein [Mycobacteroides abscessus subsp. abscessus]
MQVADQGTVARAHRVAGEAGLGDRGLDVAERGAVAAQRDRAGGGQRHHHVGDGALGGAERLGEPTMLLLVQQALRAGLADHLGQLHARHGGVQLVLGLDTEHPQREIGRQVVQRDERAGQPQEHQVDRHQQQRGALRPGQGDVLRDHLAQQDVQDHHDGERQREGHRVQQLVGQSGQLERLLQQMRDGGLADAAEQDRADGDAELGGGQHHRQVLTGLDDGHRVAFALRHQRLQPVAARGDQRELRADEERVARQQHDGERDTEQITHGCAPATCATPVPRR